MRVLATMMKPKSESCTGAMISIVTHRIPIRALNQVKMFALRMSLRLRLLADGASFVRPRATRSATSAELSPAVVSTLTA